MANALIFDMDGTLVDNMGFHTRAWLQILSEVGRPTTAQHLRQGPGGYTSHQLLQRRFGEQFPAAERTRMVDRKEALYRKLYGPHMEPMPGLLALLRAAKAMGPRMAVATSAGEANVRFVLEGLDIGAYFDVVIGSHDVPQGKTGPEIFLKTARRLAVEPAHCLVFEDSLAGIEASAQAGMGTVVVATDPGADHFGTLPSVRAVIQDYTEVDLARFLDSGHQPGPNETA